MSQNFKQIIMFNTLSSTTLRATVCTEIDKKGPFITGKKSLQKGHKRCSNTGIIHITMVKFGRADSDRTEAKIEQGSLSHFGKRTRKRDKRTSISVHIFTLSTFTQSRSKYVRSYQLSSKYARSQDSNLDMEGNLYSILFT